MPIVVLLLFLAGCAQVASSYLTMLLGVVFINNGYNDGNFAQLPEGSKGTMCVYYQQGGCTGVGAVNGLNHLAKPDGYGRSVSQSIPAGFAPLTGGSKDTFSALCYNFEVNPGGSLQAYSGMNSFRREPVDVLEFEMDARNKHCYQDTYIKNVYLLAVTNDNPSEIFASDKLIDVACKADGGNGFSSGDKKNCEIDLQEQDVTLNLALFDDEWEPREDWIIDPLDWGRNFDSSGDVGVYFDAQGIMLQEQL